MFAYLLRSFLGPDNVKSLIGNAVFAVGGALGYAGVMQHSDVTALSGALFTLGSVLYSWYRAHQKEGADATLAIAAKMAPVSTTRATALVVNQGPREALRLTGTETQQTQYLNLRQIVKGT